MNNSGYHSIRQTQNNYFPGNPVGCGIESGLPFPKFKALCQGFNLEYLFLEDEGMMQMSIDSLLNTDKPSLLEVSLNLDQEFSPKLASKKLEDGSMITAELEDMTPLLGDNVLRSIMDEAYSIQ